MSCQEMFHGLSRGDFPILLLSGSLLLYFCFYLLSETREFEASVGSVVFQSTSFGIFVSCYSLGGVVIGQVYFTQSFTLVVATVSGIAIVRDCQLRDHSLGFGSNFNSNCDPYIPLRTTLCFAYSKQETVGMNDIYYIRLW